jgi:hypothetical protein
MDSSVEVHLNGLGRRPWYLTNFSIWDDPSVIGDAPNDDNSQAMAIVDRHGSHAFAHGRVDLLVSAVQAV